MKIKLFKTKTAGLGVLAIAGAWAGVKLGMVTPKEALEATLGGLALITGRDAILKVQAAVEAK